MQFFISLSFTFPATLRIQSLFVNISYHYKKTTIAYLIKNKLIKIEKSKNKRKSPHTRLRAVISYLYPFSFHHLMCFFRFLYSRSNFNLSCVVKIIVYLSCIFPKLLCIHKFSTFLRIFNLSFKRLLSSKLFVFSTLFSKIVSFYD